MKTAKWLVTGCFLVLVGMIWLLYFYLVSIQDEKGGQKHIGTLPQETIQVNSSDHMLVETVQQFAKALYSVDRTAIMEYTTEQGRAVLVPLGDNEGKQKAVGVVVHEVYVYEGAVTEKNAQVIAAVTRTITVNGIATTSTQYIRLELLKQDKWRIDDAEMLADVPNQ